MGKIIGAGFYVPKTILRNDEISTSDQWIKDNIGIKERHVVTTEKCSDIAVKAGLKALKGIDKRTIDMLIVCTATPDKAAPSTACIVKQMLGLDCPAFDLNAVCAGFMYGITVAECILNTGAESILIIGADVFSQITDYSNRNCVFFGDGAGAVVMTQGNNFKGFNIGAYSEDIYGFNCPVGGTFEMDTKLVYKVATQEVPKSINKALKLAGMTITDIDYMVPHQPSKRMLEDIADIIGLPREKCLMNMARYANTSAGTIPILLAENWKRFKTGDKLLFTAIGSGWTFGSAIYEV